MDSLKIVKKMKEELEIFRKYLSNLSHIQLQKSHIFLTFYHSDYFFILWTDNVQPK
jgi:hypothetical protein